jgi:hypothetical protein
MPRIDVVFILLAALALVTGVVLGIVMGIVHDFQFAPVHAHLNLVGWASLALFGLIYKAYPTLQNSWLAKAHLVLSGSSAFLFPAGIYLSIGHDSLVLSVIAAFMLLAGTLVFMVNLVRAFFFAHSSRIVGAEDAIA